MKHWYLTFLSVAVCSFSLLCAESYQESLNEKVKKVDQKIEELQKMALVLQKSIKKHEEEASRWQFQIDQKSEARYHFEALDEEMRKLRQVEKQIAKLKMTKSQFLEQIQNEKFS